MAAGGEDMAGLVPDKRNANKGTVRGRALLEDSLRRYGAGRSILADKHGNVIAGNKTLESAADIGLPVRFVQTDGTELVVVQRTDLDLDSESGRSLAYLDNRVAELDLSWDVAELIADRDAGLDLAAVGFDADELAALLAGIGDDPAEGLADPDAVPPVPAAPITRLGDLIIMGRHRLLCGDSTVATDVDWLLGSARPSLMLTSPPYGVGMEYEGTPDFGATTTLIRDMLNLTIPQMAAGAFAFVNFCDRYIWPQTMGQFYLETFTANGWRWYDQRYWKRSQVGMAIWNTTTPRALSQVEHCWTFQHGSKGYPVHDLEISKEQLWEDAGSSQGMGHPAVMAVGIASKAIAIYTTLGDSILDPFCGAGTTLVAAEQLGRTCYGMEISPAYCDVIVTRWQQYTGLRAVRA